jgi:hypothetical protein
MFGNPKYLTIENPEVYIIQIDEVYWGSVYFKLPIQKRKGIKRPRLSAESGVI